MLSDYSVLMLLWYKEKPEYLQASIESMAKQTVPPAEFVFVRDHEISVELTRVVEKCVGDVKIKYVDAYELFGKGLGSLRGKGVENCSYNLIACMDSDDISFPKRCEKQLTIFQKYPELAVVGGTIAEFSTMPQKVVSYRKVPERHEDIMKFAKLRSPFNQPSVMFRKDAVMDVGNYRPLGGCEDYDLWFRILKNGCKGYNIPEPILYYRTGEQFIKRRRNKLHYQSYINLRKELRKENFISSFDYLLSLNIQRFFYYSPIFIQRLIYIVLRKKNVHI
jgi:glycosyltransferase involved in cell wall biosynthesis